MTSHRRRRRQAAKLQPKFVGPYCVTEVMENHTYKVERSGQVSVQNEARLKLYWASFDAAGQASPLLVSARRPTMRGGGMAYTDVEEILPDHEGAADTAADPPGPPPPQEEEADTPEDLSELAPPPVEQADRHNTPSEMVIPQIHEEEAAREVPPVLVDPPYWRHHPWWESRQQEHIPQYSWNVVNVLGRHHLT